LLYFSLALLVAAIPLAVAGQNIAILVAGLLLIYANRKQGTFLNVFSDYASRTHLILFALFGFTCMAATWLNPENHENPFVACGGFLGIWLLPALVNAARPGDPRVIREFCDRAVLWVPWTVLVWGLLALSQMLFGWKLAGSSIVHTIPRAQGLYSHPLTLAYVGLLFFPFATVWAFRAPRNWRAVITFTGLILLLIASKSRAAQAVAVLILVGNIWLLLKGRARLISLGLVAAMVAGILFTKNPISHRFAELIDRRDVHGEYADDRIAFWLVHWEMFKERPVLGHGENLNTEYRTKYYVALGLQDFYRKYEAHNIYLQVLVNCGVVGFSFFMLWIGWLLYALTMARGVVFGSAPLQSVLAMLIAGMTQNAFQDSEVRYALMFSVIIAVMCLPRSGKTSD
jgi:O-antigen ligase